MNLVEFEMIADFTDEKIQYTTENRQIKWIKTTTISMFTIHFELILVENWKDAFKLEIQL